MDGRDGEAARSVEAQRATKDEARREGVGTPAPGGELPARSYPDDTGVADLGVDEPVLPAGPQADAEEASGTGAAPTGHFAGETDADRREEERVRRVLEDGFPETRGAWKQGGRVPSSGTDPPDDR